MKRKLFLAVFSISTMFISLSAESIHSLNGGIGYRNNNFTYKGFDYHAAFTRTSLGYLYTFYPSYNSVVGFSINPTIGYDRLVNAAISNNRKDSDLKKITHDWQHDSRFFFNTDIALNLRFPANVNKSFIYFRLGGNFQYTSFHIRENRAWYPNSFSSPQQSFGSLMEIGWQACTFDGMGNGFKFGNISLRFVYDFLMKTVLTYDKYILPKSFGIIIVCQPFGYLKENKKDKTIARDFILSYLAREDIYSEKYKLYDEKRDIILDIPVSVEYYRRWNEAAGNWLEVAEPFARNISYTAHELGKGKLGTDEYLIYKTERISLPFGTEEEKQLAYQAIEAEKLRRIQQKERIAEDRRLYPERLEYTEYPVLDMATMGISIAPNPALKQGQIYVASNLLAFYVINVMDSGNYNIGQHTGATLYGSYQFVLKNSSGSPMPTYMFADTAYFRYLGQIEVMDSNGYIRYLPHFEMLKKNTLQQIIEECSAW